MTTWITVCDTCKRDDWDASKTDQTDGEVLAGFIERIAATSQDIQTRRVSCMMGCQRACNVAIQSDNKLAYVLGQFDPNAEDAQAIVDYALEYEKSESGQVPYRTWPDGVKGHFTSRTAPIPTNS